MLFLSVSIFIIILVIIYFYMKKTDILIETASEEKEISYTDLIKKKKKEYNIDYISDEMNSGWSINFWLYLKSINNDVCDKKFLIKWNNLDIYVQNLNIVFEIPLIDKKTQKIFYNNPLIQKWLNFHINVNNRYLDIWINNKLYKSVYLNNLYSFNEKKNITILPNYEMAKINKFRFYNLNLKQINLSTQSIYSIFLYGPS